MLAEFQKIQRESVSKQREYVDKKKATTAALQSQVDDDGGDQVQQEQQQLLQVDDAQRRIQIEALDNEIEYNETLISEREGEIQGIEQGITELNEIFRDLGMLVNEQDSGIRKLLIVCVYINYRFIYFYYYYREHLWKRFEYISKYKTSCR